MNRFTRFRFMYIICLILYAWLTANYLISTEFFTIVSQIVGWFVIVITASLATAVAVSELIGYYRD